MRYSSIKALLTIAIWLPTQRRSGWTCPASSASWGGQVHAKRVRKDFLSGVRSGVNGTPTFFSIGIRHDNSSDPDTLTQALRARLATRA